MVWTYSGDPGASTLDAVRFLLGDTVEANAIFSDEELDWLIATQSNPYFAAALAADSAAAAYSNKSNDNVKTKTVGALSISYDTEKAKEYRNLAGSLRFRGALNAPIMPYSGGISKDDKDAREDETDWVKPNFSLGMDDNEGTALTDDWST